MGAEREETEPKPKRSGTEPGIGGASSGAVPSAAASSPAVAPAAVDFDALHAALGDPVTLDEAPALVAESGDEAKELLAGLPSSERGDSSGRSNAQYASARPHSVLPSYTPSED